jgi:hypothetical protein
LFVEQPEEPREKPDALGVAAGLKHFLEGSHGLAHSSAGKPGANELRKGRRGSPCPSQSANREYLVFLQRLDIVRADARDA